MYFYSNRYIDTGIYFNHVKELYNGLYIPKILQSCPYRARTYKTSCLGKKHEKKQYKTNSLYVTLFDRFQIGLSTKFQ